MANLSRGFIINSGGAAFDALSLVTMLGSCIGGMLSSYCGANVTAFFQDSLTLVGKTKPIVAMAFLYAKTDYDAKSVQIQIADNSTSANLSAGPLIVSSLVNGTGVSIGQYWVGMQTQESQPLDLDIAINNGANIFSVNSKTFTEPAGG